MPVIGTKGAQSSQGFGQFAQSTAANYIEDVFSTYLYTGNGSTQTINNGIDLAGKGGMVWIKSRSAATNNFIFDTARGVNVEINSNTTDANATLSSSLTAFNTDGFSIGSATGVGVNTATYSSWTFREQPKFFDVVTWTGTGPDRTISHSLGSTPGCIILKRTNVTDNWWVVHRSAPGGFDGYGRLNDTANWVSSGSGVGLVNSTSFTVSSYYNGSGSTWVAYLFAHDAGGFGLTGTDNVITCGSYTGNGLSDGPTVTLGYEPQWVLVFNTAGTYNWVLLDVMRGMSQTGTQRLSPNTSGAESALNPGMTPTATGFKIQDTNPGINGSGNTHIYIAIRRGPMKTPTTGTSVFVSVAGNSAVNPTHAASFTVDMMLNKNKDANDIWRAADRLRGAVFLQTQATNAEASQTGLDFFYQTGCESSTSASADNWGFLFRRAPGFFDEVCYTGTGANRTVTHNLGVAPELMIVKPRSATGGWQVYSATTGSGTVMLLNGIFIPTADTTTWNNTAPTSSVFSLGTSTLTNNNTTTYVAYLFASCPGVSKVGSYTGSGATQVINCGFTGGARFVLIKSTGATGNWYVWDSARGIVAGNDPYLALNSSAAEVTNTDWVDTASSGFELSNAAGNLANSNGVGYIFLAIA